MTTTKNIKQRNREWTAEARGRAEAYATIAELIGDLGRDRPGRHQFRSARKMRIRTMIEDREIQANNLKQRMDQETKRYEVSLGYSDYKKHSLAAKMNELAALRRIEDLLI